MSAPQALQTTRRVIGLLVTLVVAVLVLVFLLPRLLGWTPFVVTSGSMEPTFAPGAVIMVQPVDPRTVAEDDIITFHDRAGGLTTHRVASVLDDGSGPQVFTRGDANDDADPGTVPLDAIVGKARYAVPFVGHVSSFVLTPMGLAGLVGLFLMASFTGRRPSRLRDPAPTEPVAVGT